MKKARKPLLIKGIVTAGLATMLYVVATPPSAPRRGADVASLSQKCDTFVGMSLQASAARVSLNVITRIAGTGRLTTEQERELADLGGVVYQRLDLIQSVALRLPKSSLRRLTALPWVVRVSLDADVRKSDEFTVENTGADVATDRYDLDGTGVGVAILDSGIRNHLDLCAPNNSSVSRVIASANFAPDVTGTDDTCGHGTHIGGIIAGNGASSDRPNCYRTFYGIARNANLINVRVLDGEGQGSVSGVISGIRWVISNRARYNIRVLNLSLGHPVGESYKTDPLCQAVEAAWKSGIVVVCAAGNAGRVSATQNPRNQDNEGWGTNYGSIQSPANDPYVITVGAMKASPNGRNFDQVATYSGRGPTLVDRIAKPDIVAPGNQVISTSASGSYLEGAFGGSNLLPRSAYISNANARPSHKYFILSGTSMAAPVVAGAAVLLIQRYPRLTPDSVKVRLMLSADKWGTPNGRGAMLAYGAGYLDIPAALSSRAIATRPALSPPLVRDANGGIKIDPDKTTWGYVNGQQVLWGVAGVQSLQVIWGGAAVSETMVVQGNQVLWGAAELIDPQVIWGSQVIWGGAEPVPYSGSAVDLSNVALDGE